MVRRSPGRSSQSSPIRANGPKPADKREQTAPRIEGRSTCATSELREEPLRERVDRSDAAFEDVVVPTITAS